MASSGGGAFLPNDPPPSTGQVLTSPTITTPTITGGTITGVTVTSTGSALTAPVISGAATMASGAVLTTPTVLMTSQSVTATGATGGSGTALSAITPALVVATGTSGAGLDLVTGAAVAGSYYVINNATTGVLNIYAVGGTINGTTGTTAFAITATGNKLAHAMCVTAGQWIIRGNT